MNHLTLRRSETMPGRRCWYRMLWACSSLLLAGVCGCSSNDTFDEEPVKANLRQINKAYWSVLGYTRRPPRDLEELKTTLNDLHRLDMGAPPEEALVSPRDKLPLVIIFGANESDPANAIMAYEKKGSENSRWVVMMGGDIAKLSDEEFSKATFAKNHKPASDA